MSYQKWYETLSCCHIEALFITENKKVLAIYYSCEVKISRFVLLKKSSQLNSCFYCWFKRCQIFSIAQNVHVACSQRAKRNPAITQQEEGNRKPSVGESESWCVPNPTVTEMAWRPSTHFSSWFTGLTNHIYKNIKIVGKNQLHEKRCLQTNKSFVKL